MQGWYKTSSNRPQPPACITLAQITAEWVEVYRQVTPPWEQHPN